MQPAPLSIPSRYVFQVDVNPSCNPFQLRVHELFEVMKRCSSSDADPEGRITLVLFNVIIKGELLYRRLFLELHVDKVRLRAIRPVERRE
jgi:hypothetical protein